MQTLVERGCGLDVHQATVVACLLIVRKDGKVRKQMRTFGTTTRELLSLPAWLLLEGFVHNGPPYAQRCRIRIRMVAGRIACGRQPRARVYSAFGSTAQFEPI